MKNKLGVILLGTIISLLCIYYLTLSYITKRIEQQATTYSQNAAGEVDYAKRQSYLDSIWQKPVFYLFGAPYTYKELKETELSLGLDLQGGMHVTLEIMPEAIVSALAAHPQDTVLQRALALAHVRQKTEKVPYVDAFYEAFRALDKRPLRALFAHIGTKDRLSIQADDDEVLTLLRQEVDQAIDRAFYILRARIDKFGTSQPNIQQLESSARIQIELPGVDNPARVRKLLQDLAELSFWQVKANEDLAPILSAINDQWIKEKDLSALAAPKPDSLLTQTPDDNLEDLFEDAAPDSLLAKTKTDSIEAIANALEDSLGNQDISPLYAKLRNQGGGGLVYAEEDTSQINALLRRPSIQNILPRDTRFLWSAKGQDIQGEQLHTLYALTLNRQDKPALSGDVITDARQDFDQYARPSISMQMNSQGAKAWRRVTKENIGKPIAIVLDDKVCSAPVVEGEIRDGRSQITGSFTLEEAKDLANILKSGALPAPTKIVEDVVIGPTLGKQAQKQGLISMLAGLVLVALFMIMYYNKGGLLADVALAFNIFFIIGILTQLNAALTLPGIAGIVLTIGMSIDANVLIFERIREELRTDVHPLKAIQMGYKRAYGTIIDANVTTFLTGAILYMLGQGPIKGFAITLMIGILCSVFSAVYLTRLMLTWLIGKKQNPNVQFSSKWSSHCLLYTSDAADE